MSELKKISIAVVGLGYVGLPLYMGLSKHFVTYGVDINQKLINELSLNKKNKLLFSEYECISKCSVVIVTVPTPVKNKKPDLTCIYEAYKSIAKRIKKNCTIILESTVYPGVTEEYCIPIIEKYSGLVHGIDFNVGYSPERVSPGENNKKLQNIIKIISGDTKKTVQLLECIYGKIVKKYYVAPSIKVAEASKLIENTQRDANIALINEFKIIFSENNININEVLDAARTKWNFIDLKPGLVGGHCIGVDPYYYLEYLNNNSNIKRSIISTTRNVNEKMVGYYCNKILEYIIAEKLNKNAKILVLGVTFKKNIDDIRNSKAIDLIKMLRRQYKNITVYDPYVDATKIFKWSKPLDLESNEVFDLIVELVDHDLFKNINFNDNVKRKITIGRTPGFLSI